MKLIVIKIAFSNFTYMKLSERITRTLGENQIAFICWCIVASFGAYFSMYAFRKPFNAGLYEGLTLWGLGLKSLFIISQVMGYMLSKFIGIKIISELKSHQRIKVTLIIIALALTSLLLFAIAPVYLKPVCLFINGLPLGMVWGIVFSFLEGRRVTELIVTGLAISIIVSSGFLKSIGRFLIESCSISEFWMPFSVALIFLPLFLFFLWMLTLIPHPTEEDKKNRTERIPMTKSDKQKLIKDFFPGLSLLVITYLMLVICRDFRDNFSVEIWKQMGIEGSSIYIESEIPITLSVIVLLACLILVKDNMKAFIITQISIVIGLMIMGASTYLFTQKIIEPKTWMTALGLGLFCAYMPFQCIVFERFMASFKAKGNAGFLMYICDSSGYLGSVVIIVLKEFSFKGISWISFMISFSYLICFTGVIAMILSLIYFKRKGKATSTDTVLPEIIISISQNNINNMNTGNSLKSIN